MAQRVHRSCGAQDADTVDTFSFVFTGGFGMGVIAKVLTTDNSRAIRWPKAYRVDAREMR